MLDSDEVGAVFAAERAKAPAPTIMTVNPTSSHADALYELFDPLFCWLQHVRPIGYWPTHGAELARLIGADTAYGGLDGSKLVA